MKIEYYVEFKERNQVMQVGRLRGIEKFEGEIENFIFNTFIYFKPVKRFENRSGVSAFVFSRPEMLLCQIRLKVSCNFVYAQRWCFYLFTPPPAVPK